MASFAGKPVTIGRHLGFADYSDPTGLPLGLSPCVKNHDFTQDGGRTRDGIVTTMQGVNEDQTITGIISTIYTPQDAMQQAFQYHSIFDFAGALQVEAPVGSTKMVPIGQWASATLVSPPAQSHMIGVPAYDRVYSSFPKLVQSGGRNTFVPSGDAGVVDLSNKRFDPYGLRPFGENWLANETYLVGEMVTPTVAGGNGHTYRCIEAGQSAAVEPAWPTQDSAQIVDGGTKWQEYTAVLANRVPAPAAPASVAVAGGAFAAADVYTILTATNPQGETIASPATKTTVAAGQAVSVPTLSLAQLPAWYGEVGGSYQLNGYNVYEASVGIGTEAPPQSDFHFAGSVAPGGALVIGSDAGGAVPPQRNSARLTPGQLPTPTDEVVIQRDVNGGAFAAGRDVYIRKTILNNIGETPLGPSNSIVNTQVNDAVQATVAGEEGYNVTSVGIYEADVITGADEPPASAYALVGYYNIGDTATITNTAAGSPAPIVNGTGPAGNITADDPQGGLNNTQGMRRAVIAYEDFQGTVSGFNKSSVISTIIDEDGWQLGIYHVATGPANVQRRLILPTVANGTTAGPFRVIDPEDVDDGVTQTATVIPDNATTSLLMNFTDSYLITQTDYSYRLQTIKPHPCVDLYYSPSVDRFFQSGVLGFSGHWVSRAADAATYQGDTGYISLGADGERAFCVREFRETVYSLRERSGFTLSATTADPNGWTATRRWSKVGPCGPRAVDVGKEVMPFVHRSGVYLYDGSDDPRNILTELPDHANKFWRTINWNYAETVWVALDEERKILRVGVPIGASTTPNKVIAINYETGWAPPTGQDDTSCHKVSIDDIAANMAARLERTLVTQEGDQSYRSSQFVFASSGADGTVQAIQPGRRDDNGMGIDWQYETACGEEMLWVSKIEGFNLNIIGNGLIYPSFISGRLMKNPNGDQVPGYEMKVRPIGLTPDMVGAVSRNVPGKTSEQWRMRFTNGKKPGAWGDLKQLIIYRIPMFAAQDAGSSR